MPRPDPSSPRWAGLVDLLRGRALEAPDAALFTFLADSESDAASALTRGELDRRSRALAARLQGLGLEGERALLLFPPGLDFLVAFFGCLYAGVVPAPTALPRPNRPMTRLGSIVADARPRALLTSEGLIGEAERWEAGVPELAGAVRIAVAAGAPEPGAEDGWRDPRPGPDALAFLQYTSGSTAAPKGVMITHGNLLHNSALIRDCFGSTAESRGVFWLPLFHDMGLIGGVIQTIYCGGSSTLLSPVAFLQRPLRWLQAIARTGATISGGPNFAYDLCVEKIGPEQRAGLDLSRWRVAFNGAEPVRPETLDRFAEAFAPCGFRPEAFLPCYGLAESTLLVSGARSGPPAVLAVAPEALGRGEVVPSADPAGAKRLVGSGRVADGLRVAIVDPETGRPRPDDRVGEIWVSGPSVAAGYWGRPDDTERALRAPLAGEGDGPGAFLRTGDLGFLRDGRLFVTGRIKDMIILRGRNVYPQDLERTAERCHPALRVGGAAAFAVEAGGQERLILVAEVDRLGRRVPADEVVGAVRRAIAEEHDLELHAVRLIKALTLPRTSSGKVRRHACRDAFLAGTLETVADWTRQDAAEAPSTAPETSDPGPSAVAPRARRRAEVEVWLTAKVAELLGIGPAEIDRRRPLSSYGLGSLQAVRLAGELEPWIGRPLSPTLAYDHPTIEALAGHLAGERDASADRPDAASPLGAHEPIAIVGIGCRFPGAGGPEAFWSLLRDGVEAVGPVPPSHRNAPALAAQAGPRRAGFLAEVDGFDADFFGIAPREAAFVDPQQRLLLEVAWEALEDAGHVPERLAGADVGVFVGIATNDYAQLQAAGSGARDAYNLTGGAASIAANRLSYLFDFRGPSLAIDTACSSSLVAVHLACKSLRDGEASLALAGGVNLILSAEVDAGFARAGFLAPDGRCKTFDASADGYARGEGCGVVVLKPLARALADGDRVYAVVRGGAVNQDGRTNGLTAPSGSAQEAVLRRAYRDAGVEPGRVGYVEAHGTGTLLGDPIELRALGAVLAEGRPEGRPCAIGSLKTNIGHLEAAAGIAGLIKAALALRNGAIPPSLNFAAPNPHVPFDALPLRVQSGLAPWPAGEGPALAGVSSFGFGGTNAHVVLEAAVPEPESDAPGAAGEGSQFLLPLSARSPEALRELARSYRERLAAGDLRDLVHSASVRRGHHDHRLALTGSGRDELVEALDAALADAPHPRAGRGRKVAGRRPTVAFVFSGQGGLWPGAGCALLDRAPAFREAAERCDAAIRALAGWSVLDELAAGEGASRLGRTEVAQPVQFTLQVALAALWRSWGIVPDAVAGHSLGEVAAAHVAGALTLEQAARVIVARGRAMQDASGRGLTAAVGLAADEVRRRIAARGGTLAVAAINGPEATTISGAPEMVVAFVREVQAEGRPGRVLDVDCAFHGPQMDGARLELEAALAGLSPRPASVRLVSTVTGAEADGAALDAAYWGRNLRETVLYSSAVSTLAGAGLEVFLEVGPHPVLAPATAETLAAQAAAGVVLPSLRRGDQGLGTLLRSLGALYARGADVDWPRVAPTGRFVRLPSYPWQRERYWFDDGEAAPSRPAEIGRNGHAPALPSYAMANGRPGVNGDGHTHAPASCPEAVADDEAGGLLYRIEWEPESKAPELPARLEGHWVVVGGASGLGAALRDEIEALGASCTLFPAGDIRPGSVFSASDGEGCRGVVYLGALDLAAAGSDADVLDEAPGRLCGEVLRLARALAAGGAGPQGARLWIATRGAQPVAGTSEAPSPAQATLWGLGRSLAQEHPELWGGLLDLDPSGPPDDPRPLLAALGAPGGDDQRAERGGRSFVPRLAEIRREVAGEGLVVRPGGTYLITGGLGGLGLQAARWLVGRGARRLVLLGRSGLPDRAEWDDLAADHPARARVDAVRELEEQGASVLAASVDVADAAGMADLFATLRRTWPPLRGIFHAAGVVEPRPALELEPDAVRAVLRPKVAGGRVLHELSLGLPLDFFVLFSSVSSAWGSARLADYAAANASLDALAHARRAGGRPALSVNWGPWAEGGMASAGERGRSLALLGLRPIASRDAFAALDRLAGLEAVQAVVAEVDWSTFKALHGRGGRGRLFDRIADGLATAAPGPMGARAQELSRLSPEARRGAIAGLFRGQVARVLGLAPDRVDPDRPLTTLGLDSLMAMELKNGIEAELGAVLPLSVLLRGPSLNEMAEHVAAGWSDGPPTPSGAELAAAADSGAGPFALSPGQQMLWYAQQFEPTSAAYNIAGAARVAGAVDLGAARRALRRIVARQESLRTTFEIVDEKPAARVRDEAELLAREDEWFPVERAEGLDDEALRRRLVELARRPFDLGRGPLFRVHLLSRSDAEHVFLLAFHHIIGDFWSTAVLLDEFGALYEAERSGRAIELPPLRHRYADFARWQAEQVAGAEGERHWAYWRDRLAGTLPVLDLPADRPRPPVRSYRGATRHFHLDEDLTRRVVALGEARGASLYATLLTAFQVLLSRCTGQDDLIVGSPVSGRTRPGLEGLVGYFVNMLPMRADLSGTPSFGALLERVRADVADALEHQDFPYGLMIHRLLPAPDPSRPPLFQVSYIHQKAQRLDDRGLTPFALSASGPRMELGGLPLESLVVDKQTALFDLTLITARDGDRLAAAIEYSTDLFEPATIDRLAESFRTLLAAIVEDADARIDALPLVGAAERRRLLSAWGGGSGGGDESAIHRRFEAQAARNPEAVALVYGDRVVRYGALNAAANRLARRLIGRGVGPDVLVGLCVGRSSSMMVGLLGILKAGGAYLPIDPEQPRERLSAMLQDAGAPPVLVQRDLVDRLPDGLGERIPFESLDGDEHLGDPGNPAAGVSAENLAYVIFTSGSTGRPKGVMVRHGGLLNAASAWETAYGLAGRPLRHLQAAGFGFDVFTGDWARALTTGGALVSCPREVLLDPAALWDLIVRERVDCAELVPAVAELLASHVEARGGDLSGLSLLAVGSDMLRAGLYGRLRRLLGPGGRVVNSYGVTEATIDSTYFEGDLGPIETDEPVPIGRAFAGTRAFVLDGRLEPMPVGVPGELYLGGEGLARGYLADPRRTAERFVPDPHGAPGARLYRTGDRARWLEGGALELLGRTDHQVKVRGYRIELGEVEAALLAHEGVRQAAVVACDGPRGDRRLAAYAVPAPGKQPAPADLRRWLKERLPELMVPASIVLLDALPLSPNGKVDRRALPAPVFEGPDRGSAHVAPRNVAEETLARIAADLLGHNHIGVHENVFEIGIDSILGVQMMARARRAGLPLSPAHLFRHPTIAELAEAVASGRGAVDGAAAAPVEPFAMAPDDVDPAEIGRELEGAGGLEDLYPLTPVQEGMLFHSLSDPEAGAYLEQFVCRVEGPLDPSAFEAAWARLVDRHPALRSAIRWSDSGRPYQVVHRRAAMPIEHGDWRGAGREEQARRLEQYLRDDRRRGFVPGWPPLMRAALFRLDDERHQLAWSVHHAMIDGWCLSVLLHELLDLYAAVRLGREPALPPSPPFRDYLAWLRARDPSGAGAGAEAESYWRRTLAGFAEATPLGLGEMPALGPDIALGSVAECEATLGRPASDALRALARRERVTLATVVQGAWAVLLGRYSGRDDVVFGVTVSGRPAELPGVESMVGMFINTLPARVAVDERAPLVPWLRVLQDRLAEMRRFEAVPPDRVRAWSEVPPGAPLFESIVVVQNLPHDASLAERAGRLGVEGARYLERTHYPLTLTVIPGDVLRLRLGHDARRFEAEAVGRMLGHLKNLLEAMADDPARTLGDLPLMSEAEHEQLLRGWAGHGLDPSADADGLDLEGMSEDEIESLYERLR